MARIEPLKKEEVQAETKEIFISMEKQFGMIPNLFATMAHYPKALAPVLGLYQALAKESAIEPKLQELANIEVSRVHGCHYCVTHHAQMGKMHGLSDEQIETLKAGNGGKGFSDKERVVIEYAREVAKDAENVPEELFSRLKTFFSESEIVNLTLIIGLISVFNSFNGALGVELESV